VILDAPEISRAVVDDDARGGGRHHPADRGGALRRLMSWHPSLQK
jgi:hypothetical protein